MPLKDDTHIISVDDQVTSLVQPPLWRHNPIHRFARRQAGMT